MVCQDCFLRQYRAVCFSCLPKNRQKVGFDKAFRHRKIAHSTSEFSQSSPPRRILVYQVILLLAFMLIITSFNNFRPIYQPFPRMLSACETGCNQDFYIRIRVAVPYFPQQNGQGGPAGHRPGVVAGDYKNLSLLCAISLSLDEPTGFARAVLTSSFPCRALYIPNPGS